MNIKEFANEVMNVLENDYPHLKYEVVTVNKNNGVEKVGITCRKSDSVIAPTIYIDENDMGKTAKEVADNLMRIYENEKQEDFDVSVYTDYAKVKKHLKAKLVNIKNKDVAGISAKEYGFEDLKIVPYAEVNVNGVTGSIVVKQSHIEHWDKDIKDVVNDAIENIKNDIDIKTMVEMLINMGYPKEIAEMMGFDNNMYVVTNNDKMFGAITALFVKDKMKDIMPNGFYVIPSSIHELILIPNNEMYQDKDVINGIIKSVNQDIRPEDILSDHVYKIA
jgi:hypothetical protein